MSVKYTMVNTIANTTQVKNEKELLRLVHEDIFQSCKGRIIFLAGHFPLFYNGHGAYANIEAFGDFTPYSLDIACKLMKFTEDCRKESKLILLADDINYEEYGLNMEYDRHQKSRKRNAFYKKMSEEDAKLPSQFQQILDKNNISSNNVIRHNHGKKGRENCLIFSERILRASRDKADNECAKAYKGLLNSGYMDKDTDYFIAFIPDSCAGNICNRILDKETDWLFSSSHIMMQTDSTLLKSADKESIWKYWGIVYRKDGRV